MCSSGAERRREVRFSGWREWISLRCQGGRGPASAAVELVRGAAERDHQPARGLDSHLALPAAVPARLVAELAVEVDLLHVQIVRDLGPVQPGRSREFVIEERPDALGRDHVQPVAREVLAVALLRDEQAHLFGRRRIRAAASS